MASVMLEQVAYLIPLEPHLTQLLRAVIFAVDHVKTLCADGMPMPTVFGRRKQTCDVIAKQEM